MCSNEKVTTKQFRDNETNGQKLFSAHCGCHYVSDQPETFFGVRSEWQLGKDPEDDQQGSGSQLP